MANDMDDFDSETPPQRPGKLARQVEVNDWRWLMSGKQGRRIVRRLLDSTGVDLGSFTGNSETFFREGKRSVGLSIQAEIRNHCHAEYLLMLAEAKAKE